MLNLADILSKINEGKDSNIALKVKNSETNEVLGFDCMFIADEVVFLFASPNGSGTLRNLFAQLDREACDDCWNSHIDDDSLSEDEVYERKYDIVTELEAAIYIGNPNECPIKNSHLTFDIKDIEINKDNITLVY